VLVMKQEIDKKLTPEDELQGRLFNEAESDGGAADNSNVSEESAKDKNDITVVKQHTRKKAAENPYRNISQERSNA